MSPEALDRWLGPKLAGGLLLFAIGVAGVTASFAVLETAFWFLDWRRSCRSITAAIWRSTTATAAKRGATCTAPKAPVPPGVAYHPDKVEHCGAPAVVSIVTRYRNAPLMRHHYCTAHQTRQPVKPTSSPS